MKLVFGVVFPLGLALQCLQVFEGIPSIAVINQVLEQSSVVTLDGFGDVGIGGVVVPGSFIVAVGVVVVGVVVISTGQVWQKGCEGLLKSCKKI